MTIQGLRTSSNFATDERPKNWREGILRMQFNGNVPLTALTNAMKKRTLDDPEFNWWEKQRPARRLELHATNGNLTTTNTAIVLAASADATQFKAGDCLMVESTGEIIEIAADPSTATGFTAVRARQGSTAATLDANGAGINPNLLYMGSMNEEGSLAPTGVNYEPVKVYNYTQIFRDTLEMTRTASKVRLRTKEQIVEAKRECLEIHAQGMERAWFLGGRSEIIKLGKPARSTGGVQFFLQQYNSGSNIKNVKADYSGGLTMLGLEEYLRLIFEFGSSEKVAFCGTVALLAIQRVIRKNGNFQFHSGITEYGMKVARLECPFGTLVLKNHPMLNEVGGGTTAGTDFYGMNSWMIILDMANIQYAHLKGDDTRYEPNLQANGMDGLQSGYISECGLEIAHARTHFILKNVFTGVADA